MKRTSFEWTFEQRNCSMYVTTDSAFYSEQLGVTQVGTARNIGHIKK